MAFASWLSGFVHFVFIHCVWLANQASQGSKARAETLLSCLVREWYKSQQFQTKPLFQGCRGLLQEPSLALHKV